MRLVSSPSDDLSDFSFSDLVNMIEDEGYCPRALFIQLADAAAKRLYIGASGLSTSPDNTPISFSTLMAGCLAARTWPVGSLEGPPPSLPPVVVRRLCELSLQVFLGDGQTDLEDTHWQRILILAQISLQRHLQWDIVSVRSRFLVMSGISAEEGYGLFESPLAGKIFSEGIGCDGAVFLEVLQWILAASHKQCVIRPSAIIKSIKSEPHREAFLLAIRALSTSPNEARSLLSDGRYSGWPGMSRGYALFVDHPFVRIRDDLFICAPSPFPAIGAALLPYTMLRHHSKSVDFGDGQTGRMDNDYTRSMGRRFEQMVNVSLKKGMREHAFFDEYVVAKKPNEVRSPDGLFISPDGRVATLVQAKLRPPNGDFWHGATVGEDRALWDPFGKMINQNLRFLLWAMNPHSKCMDEHAKEIKKAIVNASEWKCLCVTPVTPGVLHMPYVEQAVQRVVVEKQKTSRARNAYSDWTSSGRLSRPHLASFEEMEFLMSVPDNRPYDALHTEWREYLETFQKKGPGLFGEDDLQADFRNFLSYSFGNGTDLTRSAMAIEPSRQLDQQSIQALSQLLNR